MMDKAIASGRMSRRGGILDETGLFGGLLGWAYGLQFSKSEESDCYTAMQLSILSVENMFSNLKDIWKPQVWS